MSEIMLAVLRLPDNLFWKECLVARAQHNSIRKEAADRIAELEAENARLKLLAQSAVDYYAVNSQHPSEAHDILREALNPTSAGDE